MAKMKKRFFFAFMFNFQSLENGVFDRLHFLMIHVREIQVRVTICSTFVMAF